MQAKQTTGLRLMLVPPGAEAKLKEKRTNQQSMFNGKTAAWP